MNFRYFSCLFSPWVSCWHRYSLGHSYQMKWMALVAKISIIGLQEGPTFKELWVGSWRWLFLHHHTNPLDFSCVFIFVEPFFFPPSFLRILWPFGWGGVVTYKTLPLNMNLWLLAVKQPERNNQRLINVAQFHGGCFWGSSSSLDFQCTQQLQASNERFFKSTS